jgi:hypothetical protein
MPDAQTAACGFCGICGFSFIAATTHTYVFLDPPFTGKTSSRTHVERLAKTRKTRKPAKPPHVHINPLNAIYRLRVLAAGIRDC